MKRNFLYWFVRHHKLSHPDVVQILNYLYNHPTLLQQVHIVENAAQTPRGMIFYADSDDERTLTFIKNSEVFHSIEIALNEVKKDWSNPLYVEFIFPFANESPLYLAVLEDNPYAPWNEELPEEAVVPLLNELVMNDIKGQIDVLNQKINQAIDCGDYEQFLNYTNKIKKYDEKLSKLKSQMNDRGDTLGD